MLYVLFGSHWRYFVVFMSEYHSHTFILSTHLSHTQKHVPLTHLCITTLWPTHIPVQLTHLSSTHISLVNLSHTQFSITWIQGSLTCQLPGGDRGGGLVGTDVYPWGPPTGGSPERQRGRKMKKKIKIQRRRQNFLKQMIEIDDFFIKIIFSWIYLIYFWSNIVIIMNIFKKIIKSIEDFNFLL